ncbi:signal recognition particle-docking protein FtsY [Lysinibacillus sphaericus]|uniref:Signal recognition particle receptor FtsY n=2 Tax=Lysinibacillus TaxID=400634 RepID=A0A2S0K3U3_LYSSH|nr:MULTISPECIES: signal recognition particle-docking protein FtsY [Lysinibacillus]AVK98040.1 signal recognition particle-docking protein FtsY [Lysinibacillus sphaericus]MCS1380811.1 signal recognition particle-docking protein FtsY [Lysinibacillus sphaericus]MED4543542.1 signal recognition particle-docking protein FtsY [Lysinibacillus sphaericus]TKI19035.1 signal recognition particle-docking protein FtsY [Lysinibacillus sphaericus]TKI48427.1 signal recognition particle-docking protein FtsY [Lys
MSFFKRLKDKLIGNPTEEKVENLVEESSTELKLEDTVEPVQQESSHEELQEKVEESSASEDFIDSQASNVVEEEKQEEVQEIAIVEEPVKEKKPSAWSITQKFKAGLEKTRNSFTSKVNDLVARYRKVDEDFFEELEDLLLQADVGFETVMELMDKLRFEVQRKNIKDTNGIQTIISEKLVEIYEQGEEDLIELNMQPNGELTVILFVGVNGVGKTTTIGKLAHRLKSEGKTVVLAAGDTFRAGAIDQLQVWGDRVGCEVIKQSEGSDPAAVMYDAIRAAKNRKADVLICDTAGRLQNKVNLMNELEKVHRVISREIPNAPHEVLLALDATTGQNALVQAQTFKEVTNVTGIVLTKLDGTAKGGIVLAIRNKLHIPVKFVGLGEKMDDLQPFDAERYVYGLFAEGLDKELQNSEE